MNEKPESDRMALKKVRGVVVGAHKRMPLVLGLAALLNLQYVHEGHMDGDVYTLWEAMLYGLESDLQRARTYLEPEDMPPEF